MAFADCIFIITRTKRNIVIPLSFKFVLTILPQFFRFCKRKILFSWNSPENQPKGACLSSPQSFSP